MIDSSPLTVPPPERPADAFAAVLALRRLAATLERATVDVALAEGWTWADIGSALEMTAQAAHKRLAPARRAPLPRADTATPRTTPPSTTQPSAAQPSTTQLSATGRRKDT